MGKIKKIILGAGAVLGLGVLAACGDEVVANEGEPTAITGGDNGINNVNVNNYNEPINKSLSGANYDIDKEYYFNDYNDLHEKAYGTKVFETKDNIVFKNVTWEELTYLLESDGNHLILFGGSWCHNTRAAAGYINDFANEYGIDTIYNFDFRLDSESKDSHVRETNGSTVKGAEYNYLYGQLISSYLTNLNDWVEYKEGSRSSLTYTNNEGIDVNVAKAQVPFLFLYNKDNKVDNSGNYTGTDRSFPIVYGFEEMVDRDKDGVYVTVSRQKTYITDEYKGRLKGIFDYIKNNNITLATYTAGDYIKEAFADKNGGALFTETEKVNINTVGYRELKWLLEQDGNSLVLLGGSWCGNTRAVINTINDYAVSNDLTVYIYDTKLDSGAIKTKFNYNVDLNTRASNVTLGNLYTDLIEQYLTNIVTLYDVNDGVSYHKIEYTNASGQTVAVKKAQVPYLFSYNKDAKDGLGLSAPITGYYEKMLVLDPTSPDYVYLDANYTEYRNGIKSTLNGYAEYTGINVKDITSRA